MTSTHPPPSLGELVRIGPFAAAGQSFVLDCNDAEMAGRLADRLRDLRDLQPDSDRAEPTVFLVARRGPAWLTHPWGVWRDDEPCETTVTNEYITPYALWEITRLVLERSAPLIPVHAAAVARDGHALVLAGRSHSGKSTLAGWLTAHGWGFLTDEVALLEHRADGSTWVHPFWRPIGVRRPGPLDRLISAPNGDPEVLIPASELGDLAHPAPLRAILFPQYEPGTDAVLGPQTPAATVRELAGHLPTLGSNGRSVFHAIVDVVTGTPAYTLGVDDLDEAAATLADLVQRGGHS